jgi:hypothetical protein
LNAKGGHPGKDVKHAVIRRWIAPRDGYISIDAMLVHATRNGDGVRGRIISSSAGELGSWNAFNNQVATRVPRFEVKAGDTLDFVTECRANDNSDAFQWSPVIKMVQETGEVMAGLSREWSAEGNFAGMNNKPAKKSLSSWEKYAHVLLLSNEASFIN